MCGGSYQWDFQATVLRVGKSMRERGFRVWMDTEMMSGSTLDAMAAAVEGAHCVLICITERYKVRARDVMTTCLPLHCTTAELLRGAIAHPPPSAPRVQASANCRLEGTCACLPPRQHARPALQGSAFCYLATGR